MSGARRTAGAEGGFGVVMADGVRLHVERRGPADGLAVVLLHAFPFSHRLWAPQLEAFSDRCQLVAPDLRGHGASAVGDGQYTLELLVDDLLALLDGLSLERVVGCGISLGGYILLRALERAPERFQAVVLADTRAGADDDKAKLARAASIRTMKKEGAAPFVASLAERLLGGTTRARRPDVVAAALEIMRENTVLGICGAQLAMAARTDTTGVLGKIEVPSLIVVGEEDGVTPPSVAWELSQAVPGARLEVIPGAGHLCNFEDPVAFNRVLRSFLDDVELHTQREQT